MGEYIYELAKKWLERKGEHETLERERKTLENRLSTATINLKTAAASLYGLVGSNIPERYINVDGTTIKITATNITILDIEGLQKS